MSQSQLDLFAMDPAAELAFAKTLPGGMELSPAAQALYNEEGARRFQEFHGRRLIEVTHEQLENLNAAWRICAYPGTRVIRDAFWSRKWEEFFEDVCGFKPPPEYTLIERKPSQETTNAS